MSGGLGADASDAVYSEDVVTYADPSLVVTGARVPVEFDGSQATAGWSRAWEGVTTVGLVSKVAGASDDEEDSEWEEEEEEVSGGGGGGVCDVDIRARRTAAGRPQPPTRVFFDGRWWRWVPRCSWVVPSATSFSSSDSSSPRGAPSRHVSLGEEDDEDDDESNGPRVVDRL